MVPHRPNQISLALMLALVACIAVNLWLFRVSIFWGIVALNITKHVAIAALCQSVGLNRNPAAAIDGGTIAAARNEPSAN